MKVLDTTVGARFECRGCAFVSTWPTINATAEDGSQRLIPCHAGLRPLDTLPGPPLASHAPATKPGCAPPSTSSTRQDLLDGTGG